MNVIAVIPARYNSSRFPGKPLALISGIPMIQRVYERTLKSKKLKDVIVATDNKKIYNCVKKFGGKAVITEGAFNTGTDRMASVVKRKKFDWVMNIQGDEPLIDPLLLDKLISRAEKSTEIAIITAASRIKTISEYRNTNNVKVVCNSKKRALYFSRSPVPNISRLKEKANFQNLYKHIGIYLFSQKALQKFTSLKCSPLESMEKLEQLRAFEADIPIELVFSNYDPISVDIPLDIKKVEKRLKKEKIL